MYAFWSPPFFGSIWINILYWAEKWLEEAEIGLLPKDGGFVWTRLKSNDDTLFLFCVQLHGHDEYTSSSSVFNFRVIINLELSFPDKIQFSPDFCVSWLDSVSYSRHPDPYCCRVTLFRDTLLCGLKIHRK